MADHGQLIEQAQGRLTGDLTEDEWGPGTAANWVTPGAGRAGSGGGQDPADRSRADAIAEAEQKPRSDALHEFWHATRLVLAACIRGTFGTSVLGLAS